MKKIGVFLLVVGMFIGVGYSVYHWFTPFSKPSDTHDSLSQSPTPSSPVVQPSFTPSTFSYHDHQYAYVLFSVDDPTRVSLIPNFIDGLTSDEIREKYACSAGINGGFYTKEKTPLGGFVVEGNIYRESVKNRLIDGFLWIQENRAGIGLESPKQPRISLQSGPLLMRESAPMTLVIQNDEYARRSLGAVTFNGSLLFIMLYDPEAVFSGPMLGDLPAIVTMLNTTANLHITDAINLDGGNASVFFTTDTTLSELTPLGSLFCLKHK